MTQFEPLKTMAQRLSVDQGSNQALLIESTIERLKELPGKLNEDEQTSALFHIAVALSGDESTAIPVIEYLQFQLDRSGESAIVNLTEDQQTILNNAADMIGLDRMNALQVLVDEELERFRLALGLEPH